MLMRKTEWPDYLYGKKDITKLSIEKQRWFRWRIREEIKKAIDLIIYAAEHLPEKEHDLIFLKHSEKTIRLLQLVSSQAVWRRTHYYAWIPEEKRAKKRVRDLTKNPYKNSSNGSPI